MINHCSRNTLILRSSPRWPSLQGVSLMGSAWPTPHPPSPPWWALSLPCPSPMPRPPGWVCDLFCPFPSGPWFNVLVESVTAFLVNVLFWAGNMWKLIMRGPCTGIDWSDHPFLNSNLTCWNHQLSSARALMINLVAAAPSLDPLVQSQQSVQVMSLTSHFSLLSPHFSLQARDH